MYKCEQRWQDIPSRHDLLQSQRHTLNFEKNWTAGLTPGGDCSAADTPIYDSNGTYMKPSTFFETCDCCTNTGTNKVGVDFCGEHGTSYSVNHSKFSPPDYIFDKINGRDTEGRHGYKKCLCDCKDGYTGDLCNIPPPSGRSSGRSRYVVQAT